MTATPRLILIHGTSSLRPGTSRQEILDALSPDEQRLERDFFELDTRPHEEAVNSGLWSPVTTDVRALVLRLRENIEQKGPAKTLYFGIDECPTLITLGAYFGDEYGLEGIDYDRDAKRFAWPNAEQTLQLETIGLPKDVVETSGEVTIRVEISYRVQDDDIEEVLDPRSQLANLVIRPADIVPDVGLVRSQADVEHFRLKMREALAVVNAMRPGAQQINIFVAGPVSICLAAGRELRLRNGRRTMTFRHRASDTPKLTRAIRLTPEAGDETAAPLTEEEMATVVRARKVWGDALSHIRAHAKLLTTQNSGVWPDYLVEPLRSAQPTPAYLPGIATFVSDTHTISEADVEDFFYDRKERQWYLPNRTLLAMSRAAAGDDEAVRLARAFFWHEYLHEYQNITRYTAENVGAFANCLERIDYVADVYGVMHQADYVLRSGGDVPEATVIKILVQCMTEALKSFWTFEPDAPTTRWQQRRLRRYMNWYLRREQISQAATVAEAVTLLCAPPVIELVGPTIATDSRRIYMDLTRIRRPELVELALVDQKGRLKRVSSTANLSIGGLLDAFRDHDHLQIEKFFEALLELLRQQGTEG